MKLSLLIIIAFLTFNALPAKAQKHIDSLETEYEILAEVNDLETLLKHYKGKPLLIDIYSVYCKPCFKEFKYVDKLDKYLKKNGIEKLYVVYANNFKDDDKQNEHRLRWINLIRKYNLKGEHYYMKTSSKVYNDLQKYVFKGGVTLPWYVIVNKKGEIVDRKAPPCSKFSKLKNKLEEII
jgi:thiol-disulfide isomerase/thioredoxin